MTASLQKSRPFRVEHYPDGRSIYDTVYNLEYYAVAGRERVFAVFPDGTRYLVLTPELVAERRWYSP